MGLVAVPERKPRTKVSFQIRDSFNSFDQLGIHNFLVLLFELRQVLGCLLLSLKKFTLGLLRLLLLVPREVLVIKLLHINTRDINLCGRSNDVGLVHTADRNSIDLKRSGDEKQAGFELLEEHDALPHEPPGEQDQHCPRRDGRPELGRVGLAGAGLAGLDVVGGVELGRGGGGCGGGLLGLGEGAAVLGLDGPQPAAVVRVRPRRLLDALRQLRRRRHWIRSSGSFTAISSSAAAAAAAAAIASSSPPPRAET